MGDQQQQRTATMRVAGVPLSTDEVALLATRLYQSDYTDLARRITWALEANRADVSLNVGERGSVLLVLNRNCPAGLVPLCDSLRTTLARSYEV